MKIKKALALLLALVLTVGLLPGRALAAEDDGFTVVNTEQELNSELNKGTEKIKLGKDITSQSPFALEQKVVIDLDGHTWTDTRGADDFLNIKDGSSVTVQNGTASFGIILRGGELTLKGLELNGAVNCNGGKLVSMEDCTVTGGNGSNYPQGITVREDGAVGTIKNCTIDLTGNELPRPLAVGGGSVDAIEGCTISATNKGTEEWFYAADIVSGGSVGSIKNCTITANGKNYCAGIHIDEDSSVKAVEGCAITVKNTAADTPNDDGIYVSGKIGTVKECKITARSAIRGEGKIDEISGCTLNAEYGCISAYSIGSILSNTMTATGTYGRGIEVIGSVGTIAYNSVKANSSLLVVQQNGKVETVNGNVANQAIDFNAGGEIGTISGNAILGISNYYGTIDLVGWNIFSGGLDAVLNEGTIKKIDTTNPVDSLDKGQWYYEAMAYAYEEGLTIGIPSADFAPNSKLTRAMLTQMLWNLEEWPAPGNGKFTDVASGAWYRNSVNWAADKKVVTGYNGQFMPDNNITREDVATILYRYVKQNGGDVSGKADLSSYTDASKVSSYAQEAMQWAVSEKLIRGSSGALNPKGNTTCAEMATIMMRLVEGPEEPQPVMSVNLVSGTWVSDGDTLYDDTDGHKLFDLKSVKGNTLTFTLESVGAAPYYRIASTYPITVTLVNGKATFPVNDSWGNSGTGVITVKGDYCIHITVDITSSDPNALWDIAMDSDFYPYGYM